MMELTRLCPMCDRNETGKTPELGNMYPAQGSPGRPWPERWCHHPARIVRFSGPAHSAVGNGPGEGRRCLKLHAPEAPAAPDARPSGAGHTERWSSLRSSLATRAVAGMQADPENHDNHAKSPLRPRREHRLPRLSWASLYRPGVSGKTMLALFFATLLTLLAAAFLASRQ